MIAFILNPAKKGIEKDLKNGVMTFPLLPPPPPLSLSLFPLRAAENSFR